MPYQRSRLDLPFEGLDTGCDFPDDLAAGREALARGAGRLMEGLAELRIAPALWRAVGLAGCIPPEGLPERAVGAGLPAWPPAAGAAPTTTGAVLGRVRDLGGRALVER